MHNSAGKILEGLVVATDTQLNLMLRALTRTNCRLLVQPVWNYWRKLLCQKSSYIVAMHAVSI